MQLESDLRESSTEKGQAMKEKKLHVFEMIAIAETLRSNVQRLEENAVRDKRTTARACYVKARIGLSGAINQLAKIRDYAPRD